MASDPTAAAPAAAVTVIVPTRDRPEALARCLGALASQDLEGLELVIVDDGSRDRRAVEAAVARHDGARLLRTAGLGPAAARNLGVQAAAGDFVCLTDDDCEPAGDWARTLTAAARGAPGRVAAGRTSTPPGAGPAVLASQAITNELLRASLGRDRRLGFAPSCNLGGERELLARLPFDQSYPDAAGEDRDWWARALAAGIEARYEPAALVVHRQRLAARGFLRQQLRYGRGAARLRSGGVGERGYGGAGLYAGLVRAGFAQGLAVGALVVAAQAMTAAGVVAERLTALGPGTAGRD